MELEIFVPEPVEEWKTRAEHCEPGKPTRVVVNEFGCAVPGAYAASLIQLARHDGWSLGAVRGCERVAYEMWRHDWVAWRRVVDDEQGLHWGPWEDMAAWPINWRAKE